MSPGIHPQQALHKVYANEHTLLLFFFKHASGLWWLRQHLHLPFLLLALLYERSFDNFLVNTPFDLQSDR